MFLRYAIPQLLMVLSLFITSNCEPILIAPQEFPEGCSSCLTIDEFTLFAPFLIGENITMIFFPGNHTLTKTLQIQNVTNMLITSHDQNTTILEIAGNGSWQLAMIDELTIDGLIFTGADTNPLNTTSDTVGGFLIHGIRGSVSIINCHFTNFKLPDQNGIITITVTTKVSLIGNAFIHNNATALYTEAERVHIENCNFSSNAQGAVQAISRSFRVINTTFNSNRALRGGAVRVSGNTIIIIRECTFANNQAQLQGGAIYIRSGNMRIIDTEIRNNSCVQSGGAIYTKTGTLSIRRSQLVYNSATRLHGGAIYALSGDVYITSSNLSHNQAGRSGGAIFSNTLLDIGNSKFINNNALTGPQTGYFADGGGAIYANRGTVLIARSELTENIAILRDSEAVHIQRGNITVTNSVFTKNTGAIFINTCISVCTIRNSELSNNSRRAIQSIGYNGMIVISNCSFSNNNGGALFVLGSIKLSHCTLDNNTVEGNGGGISVVNNATIDNCVLRNNRASFFGGALLTSGRSVYISNTEFLNNSAVTGAAIYATSDNLDIFRSTFINNTASSINGANIVIEGGTLIFRRKNIIQNNKGPIYAFNSRVEFRGPTLLDNNHGQLGGAIRADESQVYLNSPMGVNITNNQAMFGGGLFLTGSELFVQNPIMISHNLAQDGGGIYAHSTRLEFQTTSSFKYKTSEPNILISKNFAQQGGGIYASSSSIDITDSYLSLDSNSAMLNGGGMYLQQNTKLLLYKTSANYILTSSVVFTVFNNSAQYGGGIFVADDTEGGSACRGRAESTQQSQCFIQTIDRHSQFDVTTFFQPTYYNTFMKNNSAERGADIYGGLLDRCTIRSTVDHPNPTTTTGLNFILDTVATDVLSVTISPLISHLHSIEFLKELSIASDPVRVKLCDSSQKTTTKGDRFTMAVTALDQIGNPVNATIRSLVVTDSGVGRLKEGQTEQTIDGQCAQLEYNVFSQDSSARVELHADGPCLNLGISNQTFGISFLPCTCPVGLQPTQSLVECTCECDTALQQHQIRNCSHDNGTIQVETQIWVGIANTTGIGFVVSDCPFDYCLEQKPIEISLSSPYEIDRQCALNRSGVLCGECEEGLSLVLATSKCDECSNIFLLLIIPFALAGILLVLLILAFNLTVATGSIHGLVFYANILAANRSIFIPFQNFLTVFISWVNLDLGIETCFYDGMSSQAKVLLQLVFPAYLFFLIFLIIILSKYIDSFAKLLSNRNPVAALGTLVLLSYSKLLRFIIAALQYTVLDYPDATSKTVWLYDGNTQYFAPDHTPRFIAAAVILIFGGLFTVLLFFGQWIPRLSKWKVMAWTKNVKYNGFMDTYHAPFIPKHRYWTGLLLFALIVHNVISAIALNMFLPVLSAGSIAVGLAIYKSILYPVYNSRLNHIVETLLFLNLAILSFGTLYVGLANGNQNVLANISLAIAFVSFVFVLFYHCYEYIWKKTQVAKNQKNVFKLKERNPQAHQQDDNKIEGEEMYDKDEVYDETMVKVDPDRYITPPIVRSAIRPDQLREPALDDLAPITTGDYRPARPPAQPAAPGNIPQVTYAVIEITK